MEKVTKLSSALYKVCSKVVEDFVMMLLPCALGGHRHLLLSCLIFVE
jgi:hypothetical protein